MGGVFDPRCRYFMIVHEPQPAVARCLRSGVRRRTYTEDRLYTFANVPYTFGGSFHKNFHWSGFVKSVSKDETGGEREPPDLRQTDQCRRRSGAAPATPTGRSPVLHHGAAGGGITDHSGLYIGSGRFIETRSRRVWTANRFWDRSFRLFYAASAT